MSALPSAVCRLPSVSCLADRRHPRLSVARFVMIRDLINDVDSDLRTVSANFRNVHGVTEDR